MRPSRRSRTGDARHGRETETPHVRVAALGSGSRGNAVLVEGTASRLLVDAGFSGADLARRLAELGVAPESIRDVVLTHEHADHARGAGVAARRWGWRLHATAPTLAACGRALRQAPTFPLNRGAFLRVGDLIVETPRTCHDAAEPVAVVITEAGSGRRVAVATDLGRATTPIRAALAGCHLLVLEANHDEVRLREGPYPWAIKQRIGGSRGHLSNRLAGELGAEVAHPALGAILLAHLSDECNDPALALDEVERALARAPAWRGTVWVAQQASPTEWLPVEPPRPPSRPPQLPLPL